VGDDIIVYDNNGKETTRFINLRDQSEQPEGKANRCLSDFIAPEGSGVKDHLQ